MKKTKGQVRQAAGRGEEIKRIKEINKLSSGKGGLRTGKEEK